ncbi:MAG: DUF721 domain-containing protein [Methylovulum sp.]|jgi:hypothetical protein|nr:DUF721 domain-containing protein [Methylovulum sp.]TSA39847.1 MAG: DUF721 domain-containing protein [Methylococcaceae bacterium]
MSKQQPFFTSPLGHFNRTIAFYEGQITVHKRLMRKVKNVLPTQLASHVLHCLVKNRGLIVYTDAAIWASQLRFYSEVLAQTIKEESGAPVETVKIRLLTVTTGVSRDIKTSPRIPTKSTILAMQNSCDALLPSEFKTALVKLTATLARAKIQP